VGRATFIHQSNAQIGASHAFFCTSGIVICMYRAAVNFIGCGRPHPNIGMLQVEDKQERTKAGTSKWAMP
jgi:hypothetical protein